jgi:hypothetical protein
MNEEKASAAEEHRRRLRKLRELRKEMKTFLRARARDRRDVVDFGTMYPRVKFL